MQSRLARKLTTFDAVVIGLASMIGAGIFSAAAPAAQVAGSGVLIGVCIAGLVAYLNAMTMAQLAAAYPESGGTYAYGRRLLGPLWGFIAGWGFVIGKLASCTAMALTFAYYTFPEHSQIVAPILVIVLTLINYFGVSKTATATKVLLSITLLCLIAVVVGAAFGGSANPDNIRGMTDKGISAILQAAGMMFFAFAGYARIATLSEEVIDPRKTIPKAVLGSLTITFVLYIIVVGVTLLCLGPEQLATSTAPLADAVRSTGFQFLSPLVQVGAAFASAGVLLSLLAGISRTMFAMSSNHDLPVFLKSVHPVHKIPHRAELIVGLIVACVVAIADLRTAIGFSSFSILIYYAIANISAWRLPSEQRIWSKWLAIPGAAICVLLAVSLPIQSIVGGIAVFAVGLLYYCFRPRA